MQRQRYRRVARRSCACRARVAVAPDNIERRHDHARRRIARCFRRLPARMGSAPPGSARPSMVVIDAPSHCQASVRGGLGGDTVEVKRNDASATLRGVAPTWVPVSGDFHAGIAPARCAVRSPVTALPFTVMDTVAMTSSRPGQTPTFAFATPGAGAQVQCRRRRRPDAEHL